MISRKYSFETLTKFSQGNNVKDAADSNIDCFLCRDACVSSTQLNSLLGTRKGISTLKTMTSRKYYFQNLIQFSQGNNELDAHASNIDGFLCIDTCVPSLS
jgi:hypothetical protein